MPYSHLFETDDTYMKFLPQILLTAAIIAVASGVMAFLLRPSSSGGIEITLPPPTPQQSQQIGVYITGAVQFPGVYSLLKDDRLEQVLQAAGGPTSEADLAAVNLAIRLSDEDHWHIPALGESSSAAAANSTTAKSTANAGSANKSKKIDLNSADVELLKTLPGIGDVRAQAILSYRNAHGPYLTVDDLLAVGGIGPATLESIRDLIEAR
ncbi:MAG: helix-hairpin-helix domain-containing protein [Chloroflexi bacterium]|nr:helix-hairpin-helix domain-containing protein [Chloroflexota bacterium]